MTLETGTSLQILWQTVKTQMKWGISLGSALFAKVNRSSEKENQYNLVNITYDHSIYAIGHPEFIICSFMEKSNGLKRVNICQCQLVNLV